MKTKTYGPLALYLLICATLVRFYWYVLGPDTISYFAIARHYLRGEWGEAINTYWSPMISWLVVPLLALGLSDVAAMRLVTVAAGALLLHGTRKLAEDFGLTGNWRLAAEYTAACMIAFYALLQPGPDLLLSALLLLYVRTAIRSTYGSKGSGFAAGAWAAGAYLSKGYALYFFLGHFALMNLVHFLKAKNGLRLAIPRQWAIGMLTFAALTAPWFAAMAYKTGHLTTGTLKTWNYRLVGPVAPIYPQFFGLIPPAREHGASMWEEPSPDLLPDWGVLSSARDRKHQAKLVYTNVKVTITILLYCSLLSLAAIFAYVVWGLSQNLSTQKVPWICVLATLVIYPVGYLLVLTGDRYLSMIFVLVMLMGSVVVQEAGRALGRLAGLVLAAGYFLSFLPVPARTLLSLANDGTWGAVAEHLRQQAPNASGRLAGCGGWNDNVEIAWALGMPSYGVTGPTAAERTIRDLWNPDAQTLPQPHSDTSQEIAQKLAAYKIDYFLALPACEAVPPEVQVQPPVAEWQGARLYRLR